MPAPRPRTRRRAISAIVDRLLLPPLLEAVERGREQFLQLFAADAAGGGFVGRVLEAAEDVLLRRAAGGLGDAGGVDAGAGAGLEEAFLLEAAVGLDDGQRVHAQAGGRLADAGKAVPELPVAGAQEGADLAFDLGVDGDRVVEVDLEGKGHGFTRRL